MSEHVPTGGRAAFRVDPFAITDHGRSDAELEALFVFCCCVAGKKATMISRMVEAFLDGCGHGGSAFDRIRAMVAEGSLTANLRRARLGKYALLTRLLSAATAPGGPCLRTATPEELERLPGVGPKTARFLILHSRRDARVAVIDTHVLKYLRAIGVDRVPSAVPTGAAYARLEAAMLAQADRLGMDMAELDLAVWSWYASGGVGTPVFGEPGVRPVDGASDAA